MFSEFNFTSLTPIVTGDHKRGNRELLATGLMGSLRYQYWLIKSMEAWQENPSRPKYPRIMVDLDHPDYTCLPSRSNLKKALEKVGPVIQLFGTTGWKRVFRLELAGPPRCGTSSQPASARPKGWLAPYNWNFSLRFKPDRQLDILSDILDWQEEINKLMGFVHHYGWLGAAPQNGFGWVFLENPPQAEKLVSDNPVFAAEDIFLSKDETIGLKEALNVYYRLKKSSAYGKKQERYTESLKYINKNPSPIGYEIRRYLKEKCFANSDVLGKPGQNNGWASYIHVSHPVECNGGGCRLRLRFCSRSGTGGGILPAGKKPEQWVHECRDELKNIKVVAAKPAAGNTYPKKKEKPPRRDGFRNDSFEALAQLKVKK